MSMRQDRVARQPPARILNTAVNAPPASVKTLTAPQQAIFEMQQAQGNAAVCRLLQRRPSAQRSTVQRQDAPDTNMSSAAPNYSLQPAPPAPDPDRALRLEDLLMQITEQTRQSLSFRAQLDALPAASSDQRTGIESNLDTSRRSLITLLSQRISLLDEEIASITAQIGPNPVSSPDHPEWEQLGLNLVRYQQEKTQHQQQLRPLQRWATRKEIEAAEAEMADIDAQLAQLPPVSDPAHPEAELLMLRRAELERHKTELAAQLTSSATEYKQFDSRWGATRYGNSPECTSVAEAGCGPTSLAMVMNFLYQEDPESLASTGKFEIVTPKETAAYGATHGRVCNNGTAGTTMMSGVSTQWPGYEGVAIKLDQAASTIRSGNIVIFLCKDCVGKNKSGGDKKYGGHYMVLSGVDATGKTFNVLDSGANEASDIETISYAELASHTAGFWIVRRK